MEVGALDLRQYELSRKTVVGLIAAFIFMFAINEIFLKSSVPTALATAAAEAVHHAADGHHAADAAHGAAQAAIIPPALYACLPFAALLLCVALLPLSHHTHHWWEKNSSKGLMAAVFGLMTLAYYWLGYGHGVEDHMTHSVTAAGLPAAIAVLKNAVLVEYIPFITLLFALYVISGGIAIEGNFVGRPRFNVGVLAIGAAIASLVGTTGAAMLLIRPLLRANAKRKSVAHTVIFFIFIVCNTGGCLLPIGDPPLFLGFLRGVPFLWTLNLLPQFLFMNLSLMAIYYVWDTLSYRKEDKSEVEAVSHNVEKFAIRGLLNFPLLAGVILCVALLDPTKSFPGTNWHAPTYFREAMILLLAGISLVTTSNAIRLKNSFNYDAIVEVAVLFVGIFICMQAPIAILNVNGASLGIDAPWKFYWATGTLSSFLDNAPTYVVFYETAKTLHAAGDTVAGVGVRELMAISLGAVFMGAMTYIGNGPNFMVKAIAEKNRVKMPSFFGYMGYSCAVLLPLSIVMTLIFFRG